MCTIHKYFFFIQFQNSCIEKINIQLGKKKKIENFLFEQWPIFFSKYQTFPNKICV